jgi:hypothetical protein
MSAMPGFLVPVRRELFHSDKHRRIPQRTHLANLFVGAGSTQNAANTLQNNNSKKVLDVAKA